MRFWPWRPPFHRAMLSFFFGLRNLKLNLLYSDFGWVKISHLRRSSQKIFLDKPYCGTQYNGDQFFYYSRYTGQIRFDDCRLLLVLARLDQGCLSWAFGTFFLRPISCLVAMELTLCRLIWVSEGAVVWSEGQCWTWIIVPPQKDNKDGRLTQNFNKVAFRYIQETHFILLRRPYSVWSCPVMKLLVHLRTLFTYLFSPLLSHRPPHPETDSVGVMPLKYSILVQYNGWLRRTPPIVRLWAQTTSTKTCWYFKHRCWPLLLRQKRPAVKFALLTYVSQQDRAVWSQPNDHILRKLHDILFSGLKTCLMLILIFNCLLQLQDYVTFKALSWSRR